MVGSICAYSNQAWSCPLESRDGSLMCILHDPDGYEQCSKDHLILLLSQCLESNLKNYQLIHFKSPRQPHFRFTNKHFEGGIWNQVSWTFDYFVECTFSSMGLENLSLDHCVLEEFYFKNCDFYDFQDLGSNWIRGSMENIKSTSDSFDLKNTKITNCLFTNCRWTSLHIYNSELREVFFADCVLNQASLIHCNLIDCRFEGNSGILALEKCKLINCAIDESSDQFLVSQVQCDKST